MLVDTHCHLYFPDFDRDREEVLQRARAAGVSQLVNVGTDHATNVASYDLASRHDFIFSTAGFHPHYSHVDTETQLDTIEKFVAGHKVCAIGEIGLDYFKSEAPPAVQKRVFSRMLGLAVEHSLPVVVHSREAFRDTVDILKSETRGKIRGVMHCFSYDQPCLKEILDMGLLVSFTGILTFKNAGGLLEVAKKAPLDGFMLETDAPYLAPQAQRGKRNEPAFLKHTVQALSAARGISEEEIEDATSRTAKRFFNITADS